MLVVYNFDHVLLNKSLSSLVLVPSGVYNFDHVLLNKSLSSLVLVPSGVHSSLCSHSCLL